MKLIIKDDEDRKTVVPIARDEYAIGRQEGNHIRLTERNVSRRHARLTRLNGDVYIEDLGSRNGVSVNGDRIRERVRIREGDSIEIGDYFLEVEGAPTSPEKDTNPTQPDPGHLQPPADKTPPLAVPVPQARAQAPQATTPRRDPVSNATAVIRLTDLQRGGPVEARDLGAHEQPRLVCVSGQLKGTEFTLRRSVVKFGRTDDGNEIVIDHQSISRSHGRFQLEESGWRLYDNKSANGIRVNGDEYEMSPVRAGDTIELGHVKFRFVGAGESFHIPSESQAPPPTVAAGNAPLSSKSKTPLIAAAVLVVLLVAGAAVVLLKPAGPKAPSVDHCAQGQAAFSSKNWKAAIDTLSTARSLNAECAFDVTALLNKARSEKSVKEQLDEATALFDEGKYRQVIAALEGVPDDSEYATEARLRVSEALQEGVRQFTSIAQSLLDDGRLDEASRAIDDIESLDEAAPVVPLLRRRVASARAPVVAQPAQNQAQAQPARSQQDRNAAAEKLMNDGIRLIKEARIPDAIVVLNKALAEKPSASYVAKACRSLGIAHARAGDTAKTIEAYKCYLKADPNTPEREKIEALIAQHGG